MGKFLCSQWLLIHGESLIKPKRLIFEGGAGPEAAEGAAAEAPRSELDQTHEANLKALADAKDDPEALAAALDNALSTAEAKIGEKRDQAIRGADGQLTAMLDAMGVKGRERDTVLQEFRSQFVDWRGKNEKEKDLKSANEGQEAALTSQYQEGARQFEDAAYLANVDRVTARLANAKEQIGVWDGEIERREDIVDEKEDAVETRGGEAVATAEDYGLETSLAKLEGMDAQTLRSNLAKAEKEQDPNWEARYSAIGKANSTTGEAMLTSVVEEYARAVEIKLEEVRAARAEVTAAQGEVGVAEQNKEGWNKELAAAKVEQTGIDATHYANLGAIDDGTFKYSNGQTLAETARATAAAIMSPEEQAIIDRYAEEAIAKANELVREVVYAKLEKYYEETEKVRDAAARLVARREAELKSQTGRQLKEIARVKKDLGISTSFATSLELSANPDAVHKMIEDNIRAIEGPMGIARLKVVLKKKTGDEAVQSLAQTYYDEKFMPAVKGYRAALDAERTDSSLNTHQKEKRDAEQRLARIQQALDTVKA